jgi:hypothetical protein
MSNEDLPTAEGSSKELFQTVNALDSRLVVHDSLTYAVEKSGQQVTSFIQNASSFTASGAQFTLIAPSLSTVISRKVLLRAKMKFNATVTMADPGANMRTNALPTGNFCLAPFAFHQLCNTITCTINNATFTFDCQNQLNEVLRCLDPEVLKEYNTYTPCQLDSYQNYADVCQFNNDLGQTTNPKFANVLNSPFRGFGANKGDLECRGSYISVVANATSVTGAGNFGAKAVSITVNICEPVLMSPFLLSTIKNNHSGGLYGINTLAFNFQFRGDASRAIRAYLQSDPRWSIDSASLSSGDASLLFEMITPHPSVRLPSRSIQPYLQIQTFKTNCGVLSGGPAPAGGGAPTGAATPISSNSIQLSSIPDSVLIGVRKVVKYESDTDSYLPIRIDNDKCGPGSVIINFNNNPGICSNYTTQQLWECSRNSGCNLTYQEFFGQAVLTLPDVVSTAVAASNGYTKINTCGSLLKLDFGRHINIAQDWYAPGSLGSFQFQVTVQAWNNTGADIAANTYELVCLFLYSGMIVSSLGSTSSYVGVLTKENVISASEKPAVNNSALRLYGSGWWSNLKSGVPKGKYAKAPEAHNVGAGYSAGSKFKGRLM